MTRAAPREQSQPASRRETVRRVRATVVRRSPRQSARQLWMKLGATIPSLMPSAKNRWVQATPAKLPYRTPPPGVAPMVKRLCLHACLLERLGGFFSEVSALRAAAHDARGSGFLTASSTCAAPCRWLPARRWFRLNAFLQRRLVGGVLHQIDIVEHGAPGAASRSTPARRRRPRHRRT